jgi:hypothetical protein
VNTPGDALDLRTYKLERGAGESFSRIFEDDALPLLARQGITVIAHVCSLDDPDMYYLVRSFATASDRNERLDAFYGGEEWRQQHRDRVLGLIESYHVVLLAAAPLRDAISA